MKATGLLARFWLLICTLLVVVPLTTIISALGNFDTEIWDFILDFYLFTLLKNTFLLGVATSIGVVVLGVSTAWLTTMYRFPCQRWLSFAMMLPMAVPAYVLAYTWIGLFDYTGVLGTFFRENFGLHINIRDGFAGVSTIMSLAFYPYVYLLAKNAFATMGGRAMEVGASLGLSPYRSFFSIAIPMSRPFIVGGLWLALMEVLADFGTVSVFNYETFTTAIYQTWFGFFSLETAKQLSLILISFVFLLVLFEQLNRGKRKFFEAGKASFYRPVALTGIKKYLACAYCLLIMTLAFFVPIGQLLFWAVSSFETVFWQELFWQSIRSLLTSLSAGVLVGFVALGLVLSAGQVKNKITLICMRIATMGYAIPGVVLAVGVFVPIAWFDNWLIDGLNLPYDSILKGTIAVMLLAFLIRFLALGVQAVQAGADRIKEGYMESAYVLGKSPWQAVKLAYIPMIWRSMLVAMLMTFVDVMKEIPITLMMRPSGFDMLSARVYAFTVEGMYDKAAFPSLIIILVGLIPVIWFSKMGQKS